jgi:hypothetical protein
MMLVLADPESAEKVRRLVGAPQVAAVEEDD